MMDLTFNNEKTGKKVAIAVIQQQVIYNRVAVVRGGKRKQIQYTFKQVTKSINESNIGCKIKG